MVYIWLEKLQSTLFPPTCLLCTAPGAEGLDLCTGCRAALPRNAPACARCAEPLTGAGGPVCGRCLAVPPAFDAAWVPFRYAHPLDALVRALKFHRRLAVARTLGALLADSAAARAAPAPAALLPVPLHPARLRSRGFNQAAEIARAAARRLGLPVLEGYALRVRATAAQSDLPRAARARNVAGAFALRRPLPVRHVALVDDVITTGQTLAALARALKAAGVETVEAWAVARTPPPPEG